MAELQSAPQAPIRSRFSDDSDFREILDAFVQALPARGRLLSELFRKGSLEELGRQAHQLKGAGGGYGFPEISAAAAELQQACRAQESPTIQRSLEELLGLFERVES